MATKKKKKEKKQLEPLGDYVISYHGRILTTVYSIHKATNTYRQDINTTSEKYISKIQKYVSSLNNTATYAHTYWNRQIKFAEEHSNELRFHTSHSAKLWLFLNSNFPSSSKYVAFLSEEQLDAIISKKKYVLRKFDISVNETVIDPLLCEFEIIKLES